MIREKNAIQEGINQDFMNFVEKSPTAFQATQNLESELSQNGYLELKESEKWSLESSGKYYVKRNNSSMIAFRMGKQPASETGFRMVGGHTDSPALKVKPIPEMKYKNYLQFAVEPYGGLLLATWFDRDLSLAGRVSYINKQGEVKSLLLNFNRAIATIPSVAIHLDRKANDERSINKQQDMPPLLMQLGEGEEGVTFNDLLLKEIKSQGKCDEIESVVAHEMFFYDMAKPSYVGLNNDFIASARIDNLVSCFIGLKGLLEASDMKTSLLICNDHEECGSSSTSGAAGTFLKDILYRITGGGEDLLRAINQSYLISADNAHAVHPNHPEKHDGNHGPVINKGPVIKVNANLRYATDSETCAYFINLCDKCGVPFQQFVSRSDTPCGSTIGPLTSTAVGVKTIDIGLPTFGMHSVRELAGADDLHYLFKVLKQFFK